MERFSTFFVKKQERNQETLQARFCFSFDNKVDFTETISFASDTFSPLPTLDPEILHNLLFHLSLAIGISYYKLCPSKKILIENGYLDDDQKTFWHRFYVHGLWEYFYTNGISPRWLCQFENSKSAESFSFLSKKFSPTRHHTMVALGGGKDSLVSVELVKQLWLPFSTSSFGKDYVLHHMVSDRIGVPRLVIQRTIDPQLFEMNTAGYYNGHVPISGIIAFVLVFASYLYDYDLIVMSNEKSANEWNTIMDGIEINHQRSKSLAFESTFAAYLDQYISHDIHYFSLLRGMYEIKIAELFSHYPQYFDVFSSCNTNFKLLETKQSLSGSEQLRRCNNCPKCAFVYAILRPFVTRDQAKIIWWEELYQNDSLVPLFRQLLGIEGIKPFECVWTNEEVVLGMYKALSIWEGTLPPVLDMFTKEVLPYLDQKTLMVLWEKLFTVSDEPNIPNIFTPLLSSL